MKKASIAALSLVSTGAAFLIGGCDQAVSFKWECRSTTASSMQCQIENTGLLAGEARFDIVAVCSDGEHVASVSSGRVNAGTIENKIVTDFSPPLNRFIQCQGTDFRNKTVTALPPDGVNYVLKQAGLK